MGCTWLLLPPVFVTTFDGSIRRLMGAESRMGVYGWHSELLGGGGAGETILILDHNLGNYHEISRLWPRRGSYRLQLALPCRKDSHLLLHALVAVCAGRETSYQHISMGTYALSGFWRKSAVYSKNIQF